MAKIKVGQRAQQARRKGKQMVPKKTVAAAEAVQGEAADAFLEKAVCISLTFRRFGVSRKVKANKVEVDDQQADQSLVRVQKDILDSKEWRAIRTFDGQVHEYLERRAVPSHFRKGIYILSVDLVPEVDAALTAFKDVDRPKLVAEFIQAYPQLVEKAKANLGPALFRASDYPSTASLAAAFDMEFRYLTPPKDAPVVLQTISKSLFKREAGKAQEWAAQARAEIEAGLVKALHGLVKGLVDKLTGKTKKGKDKIVKADAFERIDDFLDSFKARNIAGDDALAALVAEAKKLTRGVDPESLKWNDTARATLAKDFANLEGQLDALLVEKGARLIEFADEGE